MIKQAELKKFIDNGCNVLFTGKHGVGKTAMVREAFEAAGLRWVYFSASTMDPWIDFVGVPREVRDSEDGEPYLTLVRPKWFRDDEVEAIFLDEYNRADKAVHNATMELIQFRSINGHRFNNLKVIWAAINPPDESYSVNDLDEAHMDRFHVHIEVPYELNMDYFTKKYGVAAASAAAEWWKDLSQAVRDRVSPRRLEYAIDLLQAGCPIRDRVLPASANVNSLREKLAQGSIRNQFDSVLKDNDEKAIKQFLEDFDNWTVCRGVILEDPNLSKRCEPLVNNEWWASSVKKKKKAPPDCAGDVSTWLQDFRSIAVYASTDKRVDGLNLFTLVAETDPSLLTGQDITKLASMIGNFQLGSLSIHSHYNTGGTPRIVYRCAVLRRLCRVLRQNKKLIKQLERKMSAGNKRKLNDGILSWSK